MSIESYRLTIKESKRSDILKAALANFLARGYTGAAMAEIAADADVSTATLYKNFASKEALFTAVATQAAASVHEDIGDLPENSTAHEIFLHLLYGYYESQRTYRVNDLFRIVIAETPSSPELTRNIYKILIEGRHGSVKSYLDVMVGRGLLRPHDTETGARFAMGMIKELAVWPTLFIPDHKMPEDILDQVREGIDVYLARYGA